MNARDTLKAITAFALILAGSLFGAAYLLAGLVDVIPLLWGSFVVGIPALCGARFFAND